VEEAEADFEANIADLAMRFNPTLEPQPPPGSDYPTLEKDDDDDTRDPLFGLEEIGPQLAAISPMGPLLAAITPDVVFPDPRIGPRAVTIWATLNGVKAKGLMDPACEVDIVSPGLCTAGKATVGLLEEPLKLTLGTQGAFGRSERKAALSLQWGEIAYEQRSFFVVATPRSYAFILGTPFLSENGLLVGVDPPQVLFSSSLESAGPVGATGKGSLPAGVCVAVVGTSDPNHGIIYSLPQEASHLRSQIDSLLDEYVDVFPDKLPNRPPPLRAINHRIQLINPDLVVRQRPYKIADRYEAQIRQLMDDFEAAGWIRKAAVRDAAPSFAVPKKNPAEARWVVDFAKKNQNIVKEHTVLPDMRRMRMAIARATYRSSVDFAKAYHQIRVEPGCEQNATFSLPWATYESLVLLMGDTNGPNTMSRVLTHFFGDLIGKGVEIFFDNLFILGGETPMEHVALLTRVFAILRENEFYIGKDSIDLFSARVDALGAVITDEGILVDPRKRDKIAAWPVPKSKKDILRFMGSIQWLADHYPMMSAIASPITNLTGNIPFVWTKECQERFDALKTMVPQALAPLDFDMAERMGWNLYVVSDACIEGCGAWIGFGKTAATARPSRYFSHKFNRAQRNYMTTDQEMCGIVNAVLEFSEYLVGRRFTVVTDHQPLKHFFSTMTLNWRQARWAQALAMFDFEVEYLPGISNGLADGLSRFWEVSEVEPVDDHDYCKVPTDFDEFCVPEGSALAAAIQTRRSSRLQKGGESPPSSLTQNDARSFSLRRPRDQPTTPDSEQLDSAQQLNKESRDQAKSPFPESLSPPRDPEDASEQPTAALQFSMISGGHASVRKELFRDYSKDRLFKAILDNPTHFRPYRVEPSGIFVKLQDGSHRLCLPGGIWRGRALEQVHKLVGHLGDRKTLEVLRRSYWWPTMVRETTLFCRTCDVCARVKASNQVPAGLLHPLPVPSRPWEWCGMDFIGPLPPSELDGEVFDQILTVIDLFSSEVVLIPARTSWTSEEVANVFWKQVVRRVGGFPSHFVSDRDKLFVARFWKELCRLCGIEQNMSSAYHAESDGKTERANRVVGQILRCLIDFHPEQWASKLLPTELAINIAPNATTLKAPLEVSRGYVPPFLPSSALDSSVPHSQSFLDSLQLGWIEATDAILAARVRQTVHANWHCQDTRSTSTWGARSTCRRRSSGARNPYHFHG